MSEDEVIARYSRLFKVPLLVGRYLDGLTSEAENLVAQKILGQWRERLCDLSWYMRGLNEYLARRANAEDGCKGRFWTAPAHPCARGIVNPFTSPLLRIHRLWLHASPSGIHAVDRLQALATNMGQPFLKGNGLARQLYCAAV